MEDCDEKWPTFYSTNHQLMFEWTRNAQLNIGTKAKFGNVNQGESSGWFQARVQRKLAGQYTQIPEIHTHKLSDSISDPDAQQVPFLDSAVLWDGKGAD